MKLSKKITFAFAFSYLACGSAQTTELLEIQFSGNIHQTITDQNGQLISNDQQLVNYNLIDGMVFNTGLIGDLDASELDAVHLADDCGPNLYSLDIMSSVNNQIVKPADVFTDDGSLIFDATSLGLADGTNVDAISRNPNNCDLVLSFDGHVKLGEDIFTGGHLISWNLVDGFNVFNAFLSDLPVDALYVLENNNLLVSFAHNVVVNGTLAQFNDVIEINPSNVSVVTFNPLIVDSSWEKSNLNALNAVSVLNGDLIFINGFE